MLKINKGIASLLGILIVLAVAAAAGAGVWIVNKAQTENLAVQDNGEEKNNDAGKQDSNQQKYDNNYTDSDKEIILLLEELKEKTDVVFSEVKPDTFQWFVMTSGNEEMHDENKKTVNGFAIETSPSNPTGPSNFFKNKGFSINGHNCGDGTLKGSIGWEKDDMVCLVSSETSLSNMENSTTIVSCGILLSGDQSDPQIKCGDGVCQNWELVQSHSGYCPNDCLDPKEKCENSGGMWTTECNSELCSPFYCDCAYNMPRGTFKISKDNECVSCEKDADCGELSCAMGRDECVEHRKICNKATGVCSYKDVNFGKFWGPQTHECVGNKCVPIDDSKIYEITVDINGLKEKVVLSNGVAAPLSKEDAALIGSESGCACSGELELDGNFWITECCNEYPDCQLKININTGEVTCLHFG